MNLKLNEWNEANIYANKVCNDLTSKGYNIKPNVYTMYDGRKGISLQIFDSNGKFHTEYSTGICNSLLEMKKAIDTMSRRIVMEV